VFNALHGLSDKRGSIGSLPFGNDSVLRGENISILLSFSSSDVRVSMVFNQSLIRLFLELLPSIFKRFNSEKEESSFKYMTCLCMSIIHFTVSEIKAYS